LVSVLTFEKLLTVTGKADFFAAMVDGAGKVICTINLGGWPLLAVYKLLNKFKERKVIFPLLNQTVLSTYLIRPYFYVER